MIICSRRDKIAPTVEISSPSVGSGLGFDVPTIGTAKDETKFANYTLSYRAESEKEYHVFKESSSPIENDILGILNIEDFVDGRYEILLTVEDAAGNISYCELLISY